VAVFIVFVIAAYLIGAVPTGVVLTRLAGAGDVRAAGSGNIGATNVYRVAGRRLGILTLAGDMLKGVLPVLAALLVFKLTVPQVALVALVTFMGHCFPVYLGFRGGKGVATGLGIFLVLSPLSALLGVLVFGLILWKWRYVSLGSIWAAGLIPFLILLLEKSLPLFVVSLLIGGLVIMRHRDNIRRLMNGSENCFKT